MWPVLAIVIVSVTLGLGGQRAAAPRSFEIVIALETTSEDSANVSMGDLDRDGNLDLVLAKGRHTPLLDRVLLSDGKGGFGYNADWKQFVTDYVPVTGNPAMVGQGQDVLDQRPAADRRLTGT